MLVVGAAIEREAHEDADPSFSKGAEGYILPGEAWHPASSLQLLYSNIIQNELGMGTELLLCLVVSLALKG